MTRPHAGPHPPTLSLKLGEGAGRETFKPTEIGDIPTEWDVVQLGDIALKTKNRDPRSTPDKQFRYIDVASVSNETYRIVNPQILRGRDAPSRARKVVKAGDTIFATVRPYLRNIAQVPEYLDDEICSTGFCIIRTNPEQLDADFLYYIAITEQFVSRIVAQQRGSSYPAVSDKVVLESPIPLPPLDEQCKIAHILNTVRQAMAAQDDLIAAAQEVKRSLMRRLFTYGPGSEPAPTRETEIGEVPEDWEVVEMGQVVECLDHKRVPLKAADRRKMQGDIPYYGASGQIDWINDYLFNEPLLLISEDGANLESRVLPIAFCISGKSWVNNHAHVLRVTDANRCFLEAFVNANSVEEYLTGTTRPKLNKAMLLKMKIPYPEQAEQEQIAHILQTTDTKIAAEQDRKAALQELFNSLLQELMTGQLRVKDIDF